MRCARYCIVKYVQDEITLGPWFLSIWTGSRETLRRPRSFGPSRVDGWVILTLRPRLSLNHRQKDKGGACLRNGEWSS